MKAKALVLLEKSQTVSERALRFFKSSQRELQKNILDQLTIKIEKIDDKVFDLENFELETNVNAGQKAMTNEDVQARIEKIFALKYEKTLLELELKIKTGIFEEYFGSQEEEMPNV